MKTLLQVIIVGLVAWFIIWLDTLLYDYIVGLIPPTTWIGIIKLIIVIVMVIYTASICFWAIAIGSAISLAILDAFMPDKPYNYNKTKASKFQQRLDDIAKKKKE